MPSRLRVLDKRGSSNVRLAIVIVKGCWMLIHCVAADIQPRSSSLMVLYLLGQLIGNGSR